MKNKNKRATFAMIAIFAALSLVYMVPLAYAPQVGQTKQVGTATYEYEQVCKNGLKEWVCTGGNCKEPSEREPRQRPQPKPTPSPQPPSSLVPNPAWAAVTGYSQSFSQCNSLCNAYRSSGCSKQTAADYCNALFSVDLGKNSNLNSNTYGSTPIGGTTCDTNVHCYDVVSSCDCAGGQSLNLGTCVQLLYSSFTNQGFNFVQAYSTISQNLHGNCGAPRPQT